MHSNNSSSHFPPPLKAVATIPEGDTLNAHTDSFLADSDPGDPLAIDVDEIEKPMGKGSEAILRLVCGAVMDLLTKRLDVLAPHITTQKGKKKVMWEIFSYVLCLTYHIPPLSSL